MPIVPEAVRQQMSSAALKPIGWSLNMVARFDQELAGDWALHLFSHPRSRKSSIHAQEVLESAEQIRHRLDSVDLEVQLFRWPGSGPVVFLAHGWESNTSRWLPLIQALRSFDFQVIGLDAPAHGFSGGKEFNVVLYTQVLSELLDRYRPDIFIGHSAGGMAGVYHIHLEKKAPFHKLILMSVPYELEDLMNTFRQIVGMNDLVFDGLKASFEEHFGFSMAAFSMPEFVKDIDIPGLIIHDKDDSIAPYHGSRIVHKNWAQSAFYGTEQLGHSLPGEEVVAAVLDYLK
ncbi:MAG: alpha/beta hydrolase [Saprospiraceae bacterium]|nr:alpha/beta hydrolase [Lewinella sp.]